MKYFSRFEKGLWLSSVSVILLLFFAFDRQNWLTMIASLLGVTSILLNAKGNPVGQALMIVFGLVYGWISFDCAYYGEMITYVGMTVPMAVAALVSWLRHPFKGNRAQVAVGRVGRREAVLMFGLALAVTIGFYFILRAFHTANLLPSTLSVTTSFVAVYLTWRRSPYFSLAYAANDLVLILLWVLAGIENLSYLSVVGCFFAFLANNLYAFIAWRRMEKKQSLEA